ncbi:MAG: CopG family transcriptional regulator [Alphaproteobacteria bacterium]|nr:CopG family transcriptional regulator [Alphaproteobacteria bacterium]
MANRKKLKAMKRITVTVDPDDYASFDKLAQEGDVTASWLIRRSMREFLERHESDGTVVLPKQPVRRRAAGGE